MNQPAIALLTNTDKPVRITAHPLRLTLYWSETESRYVSVTHPDRPVGWLYRREPEDADSVHAR